MKEHVLFELSRGEQTTRPHSLKSEQVHSHHYMDLLLQMSSFLQLLTFIYLLIYLFVCL